MNKLKKITAVATLGLVMLTGCGSSAKDKALETLDLVGKAEQASSYKTDVNYTMNLNASYQEQTLEMALKMDFAIDVLVDANKMHSQGNMDINFMGNQQKVALDMYGYSDGDAYVLATNDGSSDVWTTQTVEQLPDATIQKESIKTLREMKMLRGMDGDKVKGKKTNKVVGEIEYETLADMIQILGTGEQMVGIEDYEGMTFPVTYQFYADDNRLASVTVDMKSAMKEAMIKSIGTEEAEINIDAAEFTMICYDYNEVKDFTIPEIKTEDSTDASDDEAFVLPTFYLGENEKVFA